MTVLPLTKEEYLELKNKHDTYMQEANKYRGKNGWLCITPELAKILPPSVSNDDLSKMEVYEFITNPPLQYFGYVSKKEISEIHHTYIWNLTTWMGDILGKMTMGDRYYNNLGGYRRNIWITAINGFTYYGTYYESSGDYCRIKAHKNG